ncbi:MAG: nucleoside kinase [Erysipelotrichaceae bacterium]|nr:nucleoside kinase [Erysipelotrichaceae bacterium]
MIRITVSTPEIKGLEKEFETNVTAQEVLASLDVHPVHEILSCRLDNIPCRLDSRISKDCRLDFFNLKEPYSNYSFQASLTLLYIRAVHDVFGKQTRVSIANSLSRGLFTTIHVPEITEQDCENISDRMRQLVEKDAPIHERKVSRKEALAWLKSENISDVARLFESAPDLEEAQLCSLGDEQMLFYQHLLPSCRYLKLFEIRKYRKGVLLRFPHYENPDVIPEYREQKILYDAFREETQWDHLMNVNHVSDLNRLVAKGQADDLILLSEALHEKKIAQIAEQIHHSGRRIILIAGPSSSGKTSFAKRLCIQLRVIGLNPLYLGTDDYFINRDDMEVDENGNRDYESLSAVDTVLFARQMNELLAGKKVDLPEFDFIEGVKRFGHRITSVRKEQPILIEGIHALNPKLSEGIDDADKFRIYISPLTQLNIDIQHRIPTTDARLFRRLVRDHRTRGRSAATTIHDWQAVRRGEDKFIFPFNEQADAFFNSQCLYELAVLKKHARPLLEQITPDLPEYPEAQRYLQLLKFFVSLEDESAIPCNSLIREFIGGSVLVK